MDKDYTKEYPQENVLRGWKRRPRLSTSRNPISPIYLLWECSCKLIIYCERHVPELNNYLLNSFTTYGKVRIMVQFLYQDDHVRYKNWTIIRTLNVIVNPRRRHVGRNLLYVALVNLLVCSLPLHRHSWIGFNTFRFIDS
jgi:hypothetical protein